MQNEVAAAAATKQARPSPAQCFLDIMMMMENQLQLTKGVNSLAVPIASLCESLDNFIQHLQSLETLQGRGGDKSRQHYEHPG